jgi:hypothetical protein
MTKARNEANLSTAEGRSRVNSLNQAIDANNAKIKSNIDALTKQKMNVGNYTDSILQAIPGLGKFSGGISGLNTAFKANPIGIVITALIALKGIFSQNAVVADKLSFIVEGFNKGLQSVIDSIVTTVSSLDNLKAAFLNPIDTITSFFNKTKEAAVAGYEAAEAADAFGAAQARANQEIKIADIQITSLEKSLKDRTKSEQERIAIANKIADMEIANSDRRAKIAADELANEQLRLKGKTLSGEEETRLVELQTSVLEANEEKKIAASSRTTRVNILLAKEESAAKKEIATRDQEEEEAADAIKQEKENQKSIDKLARIANENKQIIALNEDLNIQLDAESVEMDSRQEAELQKSIERGRRSVELTKVTEQQKLGFISQSLNIASGLLDRKSGEYKALAVTQGLINTYAGASAAVAPPPVGAGPVFGPILAALTIARGLVNVGKIAGFANGGIIQSGFGMPIQRSNGDNVLATVKTGEVILNQRQQSALGGASTFRSIGVPGFADGGVVGFPSSTISGATNSFFDLSRLEQTISNLKVQVAVTDINDGQKNYAEITDRAQF